MKSVFMSSYALALLLATASFANAQSRITITGGPGSDNAGAPALSSPTSDVAAGYATSGGLTEQRVRQIIREELQRAGVLPPPGMDVGPFGVNPNPFSPPRTNVTVTSTGNVVSVPITGSLIGLPAGGTNAVGIATPIAPTPGPATRATTSTGPTGPGGSVGVISGGSAAVGVATPSGAGASRSAATSTTGR